MMRGHGMQSAPASGPRPPSPGGKTSDAGVSSPVRPAVQDSPPGLPPAPSPPDRTDESDEIVDTSGNRIGAEELKQREAAGRDWLRVNGITRPEDNEEDPFGGQDPEQFTFDKSLGRTHFVLASALGLGVACSLRMMLLDYPSGNGIADWFQRTLAARAV